MYKAFIEELGGFDPGSATDDAFSMIMMVADYWLYLWRTIMVHGP